MVPNLVSKFEVLQSTLGRQLCVNITLYFLMPVLFDVDLAPAIAVIMQDGAVISHSEDV